MEAYEINSFSSGELTPRALGRVDVPAYKNGAKSILNGIVLPQGGVTRKPGSFMLEVVTTGGSLLEFQGTDGVGYVLVFHNLLLKVYLEGVEHSSTDIVTLYTTAKISNIQFAIDGNKMYMVDGSISPQVITYTPSTGVFATAPYASTAVQAAWDTGADFESSGNYPYCVTFYEGRLIFGNTDDFPNYIWGSNVKDNLNFIEVAADIVATDGFEVKVNSKRGPKVLWLSGQRGLFVGTTSGVFSISDENTLLSPVSLISAKQNSSYPANTIPGFELGGELFYVQAGERKIRLAVFDKDKDIYDAPDITTAAEHITSGRIKKITVQLLPETVIWVVLEDGDIIVFSYSKENKVNAWSKLSTTGDYKDVAIVREGNTETVYVIADRDGIEYLEKFNPIDFADSDYMYLDSALTIVFGTKFTITNIVTVSSRVKVTTSVVHGYSGGEYVGISDTGIEGIDSVIFKIEVDDTTNFFLLDEILESDILVVVTPAVTTGFVQEADNEITGLTHLEDSDVSIMSGPVNVGTGTVESGAITVVTRRTTFTVGLNYFTDIIPMNIGIARSRKKNIKHLSVELYKTIAPKGGKDEDNLDFFRYERNIVMNEAPEMFTGLSEIPHRGGSEYAGEILIRQSLPLPMTVLSIIAEMEVY